MIDARLLAVAALVASPAAYRSAQGLLSPGEAMTRYLLVAFGCVLVSVLVRAVWPLVSGPDTAAAAEAALRAAEADSQPDGRDSQAGFGDLGDLGAAGDDDLEGFGGFSAFDDLEPA